MTGPDIFSFEALWRHYRRCRRNKRNTANALAFELDAETKLLELQSALRGRSYRPGRSVCFITDGPKPREVFAADFRDRVVHHLLVAHQERVFEPIFIHDSYACRKGKGTLAASERLTAFLRQATANGKRPAWGLKLDVASFFPSIHKATLREIIFVGWCTCWNRRVPRRRTLASLHRRVQEFERAAVRPACAGTARCIELNDGQNAQSVERLRATLASYSGHLRHGVAWRAWTAIWDGHPWLGALFARAGWGLEARWSGRRTAGAPSLRSQYAALLRRAGEDSLLFLEVGRFIEFYGPQRRLAARLLGLRSTRLRRACYAFTVGFSDPALRCLSAPRAQAGLQGRVDRARGPGDGALRPNPPACEDSSAGVRRYGPFIVVCRPSREPRFGRGASSHGRRGRFRGHAVPGVTEQ